MDDAAVRQGAVPRTKKYLIVQADSEWVGTWCVWLAEVNDSFEVVDRQPLGLGGGVEDTELQLGHLRGFLEELKPFGLKVNNQRQLTDHGFVAECAVAQS